MMKPTYVLLLITFMTLSLSLIAQWDENGTRLIQGKALGYDCGILGLEDETFLTATSNISSGLRKIYLQKYDANGSPLWIEGGIPVGNSAVNEDVPRLEKSSDGEIIVVWLEIDPVNPGTVCCAKFDTAGNPLWRRSVAMRDPYSYPAVLLAADDDGGCFVFTKFFGDTSETVWGQHFDGEGNPAWGIGMSFPASCDIERPGILISDNAGGAYYAFDNYTGMDGYNVGLCHIDANGGFNQVTIASGSWNDLLLGVVGMGTDLILAWSASENEATMGYLQRFGTDLQPVWDTNTVFVSNAQSSLKADLKSNDNNEVFLVFCDDYEQFYAMRYSAEGTPLWTQNAQVFSMQSFNNDVSAVATGDHGLMVCWRDWIDNESRLLVQGVDESGNLMLDEPRLVDRGEGVQYLGEWARHADRQTLIWKRVYGVGIGIKAEGIDNNGGSVWTPAQVLLEHDDPIEIYQISTTTGNGKTAIITPVSATMNQQTCYLQIVDINGPLHPGIGVPLFSYSQTYYMQKIRAIYNQDGDLVVFRTQTDGNQTSLVAQCFDDEGNSIWGNAPIIIEDSIDEYDDYTISRKDDRILVAWPCWVSGLKQVRIQALRNGQLLWGSEGALADMVPYNADIQSILLREDYLLEYLYGWSVPSDWILVKRFGEDGLPAEGWTLEGLELNSDHYQMSATVTDQGLYLVTYGYVDGASHLLGYTITPSGQQLFSPPGMNIFQMEGYCDIESLVWSPSLQTVFLMINSGYMHYLQAVSNNGLPYWGLSGMALDSDAQPIYQPLIAPFRWNDTDGCLVLSGTGQNNFSRVIQHQIYTLNGSQLISSQETVLCDAIGDRWPFSLHPVNPTAAIYLWQDGRAFRQNYEGIYPDYALYGDKFGTLTGHDDETETVPGLRLFPIYPNPFNPEATIPFSLAQPGQVRIDVFNVRGQRVATVVNDKFDAGHHVVKWDGTSGENGNAASGVYFFRLRSGSETRTVKGLLLK